MARTIAETASDYKPPIANLSNAPTRALGDKAHVLGSKDILLELERRGIERTEIAKLLNIDPSQVTRLYAADKPRHLKHDEAVKLVAKYKLERAPEAPPLPAGVWRLLAHHVSSRLGLSLEEDDPRLRDVASDLAAFSKFVRNPKVQGSVQAAEHFFEALNSVREPDLAGPPENDPQPVR